MIIGGYVWQKENDAITWHSFVWMIQRLNRCGLSQSMTYRKLYHAMKKTSKHASIITKKGKHVCIFLGF